MGLKDAAASLDAGLFSDEAATDDRSAGVLNGVTPLTPGASVEAEMMELSLFFRTRS